MPSIDQILAPKATSKIVVGIDLRSNPSRPTGWALCQGQQVATEVLYTDEEILDRTIKASPDLVSIDAPLSLPRGRISVSDDSPCRKLGGIVREAERVLWSRHIRVYPALIRQMQGLTSRGIAITKELQSRGIRVVESYPGAAQDVLNIPRKKGDQDLLDEGLRQFGYKFPKGVSHDELDAITSAMVGHFFLANEFEAIGADDEGYMINPRFAGIRWSDSEPRKTRCIFVTGLPGAGKTTLTRQLSHRLGWEPLFLGEELRTLASECPVLKQELASGHLAPEETVTSLIKQVLGRVQRQRVIIDGFPRHLEQLKMIDALDIDWMVIWLDVSESVATTRLQGRGACKDCGHIGNCNVSSVCPVCGSTAWHSRTDDTRAISATRIHEQRHMLEVLLESLPLDRRCKVCANRPLRIVASEALLEIDNHLFY